MTCTSPRLFRHRTTFQLWIAGCGRWACASCIHKVARRWRAILNWAIQHGPAPQYFMTLTLREPLPLWREATEAEAERLRAEADALAEHLRTALTRLVAEIRKVYGAFEYFAVVELTTGKRTPGHRPHLHLLVRGPALHKRWLSQRWEFHSKGSFIVDYQPLRSPQEAGDYLIGYTMLRRKRAQRAQMENWPGPRIRSSRKFLPLPVDQIRAILWPTKEPGMWEYIGPVPWHMQLTLVWPEPGAVALPTLVPTG